MSAHATPFLAESGLAGRASEAMSVASLAPSDPAAHERLEAFYASACEAGRAVVTERMPAKIAHLTAQLTAQPGVPRAEGAVPKRSRSSTPTNADGSAHSSMSYAAVAELWDVLRAEAADMVDATATLKLWLQLRVPRIEDGNNFGVGVQSDVLGELSRAEDAALMTADAWPKYAAGRAKLVAKAEKHAAAGRPAAAQAYAAALAAADARQMRVGRLALQDVRDHYAVLYDMVLKNAEKLLFPRSSNATTMY